MAAPFLIQAVSDLLSDIPDDGKNLLDLSCKEGDILQSLHTRRFTLRGTNFEESGPQKNGIPIVRQQAHGPQVHLEVWWFV
mgnify:CR=1 FL=1